MDGVGMDVDTVHQDCQGRTENILRPLDTVGIVLSQGGEMFL